MPVGPSCIWTLYFILKTILKAFSPIIPFITDFLYRSLFAESINYQTFEEIPKIDFKFSSETTDRIKNFNGSIWKLKQEKQISLKDKIELKNFPTELYQFKDDLISMHSIMIK